MRPKLIIDKAALASNYRRLCDMCKVEVIPVLKSNAYGLGSVEAMRFYEQLGAKRIAVSRISEAELLISEGSECEIILLSSTGLADDIEKGVHLGVTLSAGCTDTLSAIDAVAEKADKKVRVHLLIDTGFSHSGICESEYEKSAELITSFDNITVTGIFTQFAESHAKKSDFTKLQNERFARAVAFFKEKLGEDILVHAANSCAAVKYPEMRYDAVRIGSGLLGRLPAGTSAGLEKIGYLECAIREIKTVQKGEYIGYSRQYKTKKAIRIAIIPTGLSDGIASGKMPYGRRRFLKFKEAVKELLNIFTEENIYVTVGGKRVPIVGKVSQHCVAVDVSTVECSIGDTVRFEISPLYVPMTVERKYV